MSYTLCYSSKAEKYLTRLPKSKAEKILARIEFVAHDPFKLDNNIAKLKETNSSYRLRIGDIRVIYHLDTITKTIYVVKISPRGSTYSP